MPNWIDNPRYQRVIQRLQGLPSWQRAIFSSAGADKAFASDEMRNKIDAINAATRQKARRRNTEYGKERLAQSRDRYKSYSNLRDKEWGMNKDDRRLGEYLGYGNVALSGLLGYQNMKLADLQAEQERTMRNKLVRGLDYRLKY